jgi:uncharacterized membrane protein
MAILIVGLALFFTVHIFSSLRERRQRLIDHLGENRYRLFYSLLAVVGLGLTIWGYSRTAYVDLWQAPAWGKSLAPFFMLPALYGVIAANMPSNLKRVTRSPMAWGVLLWAVIHLLNNGDLASLLLFGSFGVYCIFNIISTSQRPLPQDKPTIVPVPRELLLLALAVLSYLALVMFHPALFGVSVF